MFVGLRWPGVVVDRTDLGDEGWSWNASVGPAGVTVGTGEAYGGVGANVYIHRKRTVLTLGVGADEEHPLSIRPKYTDSPTRRGHRCRCLSWCGLFVQRYDVTEVSP